MITLTLNVPNVASVMGAGYTYLRVLKSATQTVAGPYNAVLPDVPLVANTTIYTFVDGIGTWGDWYETQFVILPAGTTSGVSSPQPGYLSDLCNGVRDLLGVTTGEVTDQQIQGFAFLPAALADIRSRLPTFDTKLAAGDDTGNTCLAALTYLTAAYLSPRMEMQVMNSERFRDWQYVRGEKDWVKKREEFLDQFDTLISQAAGEDHTQAALFVPGVLLAGPTRGGYDTTGGLRPFTPKGGVDAPKSADTLP